MKISSGLRRSWFLALLLALALVAPMAVPREVDA